MKTALFVIARLKSMRLRKKVTRRIHGKPMLERDMKKIRSL